DEDHDHPLQCVEVANGRVRLATFNVCRLVTGSNKIPFTSRICPSKHHNRNWSQETCMVFNGIFDISINHGT
ncbi:hypothetical protein CCACVL1_07082, partial [Corchorus capsularis]